MIDTIIFDLEGVVIDSEKLWDESQKEFLKQKDFVYDRNKIKHLITGKSLIESSRIIKHFYGLSGSPEDIAKERLQMTKEFFKTEITLMSGFNDFYNKVKEKYKICIATSLDRELLDIADKKLGLSKLFNKNIFSISDIGHISKPNPDIFLFAAGKLNSKPENCLVIEDSPNGIEAAKRAGMKCVAITTTYERDTLSRADIIVDSYSEIDLDVFREESRNRANRKA